MKTFLRLLVGAFLLAAPTAGAQTADAACFSFYQKQADSLSQVHLRSTKLTQYQIRSRTRLDSLLTVKCVVPDSIPTAPPPVDTTSPPPDTTAPPPAPTYTVTLSANRDTIWYNRVPTEHWVRFRATVREADGDTVIITAGTLRWSLSDSSGVTIAADTTPWRFEILNPTRTGTTVVTARWVATGASASRTVTLIGPTAPTPTPTPTPSPSPLPADTSAVSRLMGPYLTSAQITAFGGFYAKYEGDFVRWDDTQWTNTCRVPVSPDAALICNQYDRAAIYYVWWRRTGLAKYRGRADTVALRFRAMLESSGSNYGPVHHHAMMDGLMLHAALTGDAASALAVGKVADRFAYGVNALDPNVTRYIDNPNYQDNRMQAYTLNVLLAAYRIQAPSVGIPSPVGIPGNNNWASVLRTTLNKVLGTRDADGQWRGAKCGLNSSGQLVRATHPFTIGLLHDALIRYYEHFEQDPRIPAAIQQSAELLWAHDWLSASQAFKYVGISCPGEGGPTPAADLNNLLLNGFAWTARRLQSATWQARADAIFAGSVNADSPSSGPKQFNQSYTSSYRALAWRQ